MPYKESADKTAWERANRAARSRIYLDAADFADRQIAVLREMGIRHVDEEWKVLRADLIKSRLNRATAEGLHTDPISAH